MISSLFNLHTFSTLMHNLEVFKVKEYAYLGMFQGINLRPLVITIFNIDINYRERGRFHYN